MQTDGLKALNQKLEVLLVLLPLQFTETTLERKTKCDMYNRKRARENIIKKKTEVRVVCVHWCVMYLVQVVIGLGSLQVELLFVPVVQTCQQLIEHVVVPLLIGLRRK